MVTDSDSCHILAVGLWLYQRTHSNNCQSCVRLCYYSAIGLLNTLLLFPYFLGVWWFFSSSKTSNTTSKTIKVQFFSAIIGEVDEELDKRVDFDNVKAAPLGPIWIQG